MFVYRLTINPLLIIHVSLDTTDPDTHKPLDFKAFPQEEGLPEVEEIVEMIREEIGARTGIRGHLLGCLTTPADLHSAMQESTRYNPMLIVGAEIMESYAPEPLPPGAAS